jgi:DNA-binding transcriptional LysR family regulator
MSLAKSATLRQLATFRAVARLGSVSLAADELHLSQSAVSIQLGSRETAAGAPLVSRTGRGVRLTETGELLLAHADRLLALWHETSDEIASFLGEFSGTLRVGAVTTAEYWLPRLLVGFVQQNPKVQLRLSVANREEVVRSLSAQQIDIAVMGRPPAEISVASSPIGKNPMAFVAAPGHALLDGSPLSMARLAVEPLLVRERGSGTRLTVERLFKEAGLRLRVGSELSSNEAIKQMCVAGFGPAYLSLHTCVLELDAGLLQILPLANNPTEREWHVVHLADRPLPKVAAVFASFLRQGAPAEMLRPLRPYLLPEPKPAGASAPLAKPPA